MKEFYFWWSSISAHTHSHWHTHTTLSDSLKYISPNEWQKRRKKMIPKLATAKSNFPWQTDLLFTKKYRTKEKGNQMVFSNFLRKKSRFFYGFFRESCGRPWATDVATSIFVSLIHAILGTNCDIEEAKKIQTKKRNSCVVFIIPATTGLWRHASSTLCFFNIKI